MRKKYKGDCRICGQKGHKSADCWEKEVNRDKRPPNWKPRPKNHSNSNEAAHNTTSKAKYYCNYCKKDGHTEDRCFKKKNDQKSNSSEQTLCIYESILSNHEEEIPMNPRTFIADTGATSHMVYSKKYLINTKKISLIVTAGNNEHMECTLKGDFQGLILDNQGIFVPIVLTDVLYVPDLKLNLLSITKCIAQPNVTLHGTKDYLSLKFQNNAEIPFQKQIQRGSGTLFAADIIPNEESLNLTVESVNITLEFDTYHKIMGHPNNAILRETAKKNNVTLINSHTRPCPHCVEAKIRMKNIPKRADNPAKEKGERIFIDLSWIRTPSFARNKYWLLIMDEFTHFLWSFFLRTKDELVYTMINFINNLQKTQQIKIKYIRCDNASENRSLQDTIAEKQNINCKFEYTAPASPQQNGKIERKFASLNGKVRAMLNHAEFTWPMRQSMWAYAALLATKLDNILILTDKQKTPYELFYGSNPKWVLHLHSFGEIAIVKNNKKIKSKLENKGFPAIYLGPAEDHKEDVYNFWNTKTRSHFQSRTAIFLQMSYGEYYKIDRDQRAYNLNAISDPLFDDVDTNELDTTPANLIELEDENEMQDITEIEEPYKYYESDDTIMTSNITNDDDDDDDELLQPIKTRLSGLPRAMHNLQTYYNPNPGAESNLFTFESSFHNNKHCDYALLATIYDGSPEPKSFKEAQSTPDFPNWWKAMVTEFTNMEQKGVWEIVLKSQVPNQRKIIGCRWVFARKADGRYRGRCVAKGFSQIPGKDFQENHAPVVSDTTLHLIIVIKLLLGLASGQFDIETAFLYGDLEEELWMEIPDGYSKYLYEYHNKIIDTKLNCLKLKKAIYGLVQAARQWWKKFKEVLQSLDYYPSKADPCLFIRNDTKGNRSFLIIYVDDGGILSTQENIDMVLQKLSKTFVVKNLGKMEDFVGCKILTNKENNTIWLHQPKLIKHLKEQFGSLVENLKQYTTPAAPKSIIIRPETDDNLLTLTDQTKFRSGVGMLLYLVKHTRLDIANAVRELSKVADRANQAHWKALLRTIKYTLDTQNLGLKMKPNKNAFFRLEGISDSDYAGDKETRQSVFGYVIYFCGAPIAWKSKSAKSVTLSSTEAEYIALSEVTKEIMFVKQVLDTMGIEIGLPIYVKVDNVGAIYLSKNFSLSQRTKHIDIRTHFVRQFVEDGIIKVVFISTDDNDADIHTKNTTEETFINHSEKNLEDVRNIN
jgi:hypothetical protein